MAKKPEDLDFERFEEDVADVILEHKGLTVHEKSLFNPNYEPTDEELAEALKGMCDGMPEARKARAVALQASIGLPKKPGPSET